MKSILENARKSRLAKRLIIRTVLFSSAVTLLLTLFQLYRDYSRDMNQINDSFSEIRGVHLATLTQSLWATNRDQLQLQLEGILRIQDMHHVVVREGDYVWGEAGQLTSRNTVSRDMPLYYEYDSQRQQLGTLTVVASLDGIYQRLLDEVVVILVSNGIKTFLVAGFLLLLFDSLVARHVRSLSAQFRERIDTDSNFALNKSASPDNPDELDGLVSAINAMQAARRKAMDALRASEQRMSALFNNGNDAIFVIEPGTMRIKDCNTRAIERYGYTREELQGMTVHDIAPADATHQSSAALRQLAETGSAVFSRTHVTKDGKIVPVEISSRLIDLAGEKTILSFVRDMTERQKAAEALRAERDFSTAILNTVAAIVVVLDRQANIIRFNRACERLTGYSAAEVVGRKVWDFLLPAEQIGPVKEIFANLAAGSFMSRYENEWLTRSRDRRLISWSNSVLVDDAGEVEYVIASGTDISERKRHEIALRESEARYRRMFETSAVSLWEEDISDVRKLLQQAKNQGVTNWEEYFHSHPDFVWDCIRAVKVLNVNPESIRLYGATSKEQLLHSLDTIFTEESLPAFSKELVALAQGHKQFSAESVTKTLQGEPIEVLISVQFPPAELESQRMVVGLLDIRPQKELQRQLLASEKRFRSIFDHEPHCVKIVDLNGKLVAMNAAGLRILEAECVADISSNSLLELITPDFRQAFSDLHERVVHGETASLEFEVVGLKGTRRWLETHAVPFYDSNGTITGILGVTADITDKRSSAVEREQILAELSSKNAEMESLIYTVSHDLKAPLVTIGGFAGLLGLDLEKGDQAAVRDSLAEIRRAVALMQEHIEDILVLSRASHIPYARVPISLQQTVETVTRNLAPQIASARATITTGDLPFIEADPSAFVRVFTNLLDNAVKYRRPDVQPEIEIGCVFSGDELQIYVRDNGSGITPAYHNKIFNLFERADSNIEGTGVGLAIARRVIEAHGGRMWLVSAPKVGSTFWIGLPRSLVLDDVTSENRHTPDRDRITARKRDTALRT